MNIVDCKQLSGEWLQARTGRITASEVADAVSFLKVNRSPKKKGDSSDTRDKYIRTIVAEILTGKASEQFVSKYMIRGTELEPMAREEYSMREGVKVRQVGFVIHPTILRSGASPDGIIPERKRGLEIKVPKVETHLGYMLDGVLPVEYEPQVMWGLACCPEYEGWDFVSFCPDIQDEDMQMFKVYVPRNEERIAELEAGVQRTLKDVDAVLATLRAGKPPKPTGEILREQLENSLVEGPSAAADGISDADIEWWYKQAGMTR